MKKLLLLLWSHLRILSSKSARFADLLRNLSSAALSVSSNQLLIALSNFTIRNLLNFYFFVTVFLLYTFVLVIILYKLF